MEHPTSRVVSFTIVGPFTLSIDFDDGVDQVIDFFPVLQGEMYGPLRDPYIFNAVRIEPETGTLVWLNGADFDPGHVARLASARPNA